MSTTVEWVRAPGTWDRVITPQEMTDEDSQFFDADGGSIDPDALDEYGIVLDSGGHYTLVNGTIVELRQLALKINVLVDMAYDHMVARRISDREQGTCDTCDKPYDLASREGRCGDCGMCAEHCPHKYDLDSEYVGLSTDGNVRVTLSHIGEGFMGDYDADDPVDRPLLRFDINIKLEAADGMFGEDRDDGWFYPNDGSWCTELIAREGVDFTATATRMANQVVADLARGSSIKHIGAQFTYWSQP